MDEKKNTYTQHISYQQGEIVNHSGTVQDMTRFSQRLSLSLNLMCLVIFLYLIVINSISTPPTFWLHFNRSLISGQATQQRLSDKPRHRWMGSLAQRYQACENFSTCPPFSGALNPSPSRHFNTSIRIGVLDLIFWMWCCTTGCISPNLQLLY